VGSPRGYGDLPEGRESDPGKRGEDVGDPGTYGRHGRGTSGYVPSGGALQRGEPGDGEEPRSERHGAGADLGVPRHSGDEHASSAQNDLGAAHRVEVPRPGGDDGGREPQGGANWSGRDEGTYRSSGVRQGPPASKGGGESGYGQQSTYGQGGYGEGSGFTRRERSRAASGDAGGMSHAHSSRWTREQTHGQHERRDASSTGGESEDGGAPADESAVGRRNEKG
jgi:hypothetical protein